MSKNRGILGEHNRMTAEKKEITDFQIDQWKEWYEEHGCYDISKEDIETLLQAGEDMAKTVWQEHHLSYGPHPVTVKIRKGVHQVCRSPPPGP